MRLPYFWDEAGYYIPAALDFFKTGSLIPYSTITNAHPPLPSILLAAWWSIAGCVIVATRTLLCMVSAAALLGLYRLVCNVADPVVAAVTTLLTAIYPVWFAQSTLFHADMFAAAFTLWALALYFEAYSPQKLVRAGAASPSVPLSHRRVATAILFSLAALSKETAIVTPVALSLWEFGLLARQYKRRHPLPAQHLRWMLALLTPSLPLVLWYAFHYHRTGFIFGNPAFLRYNATANLEPHRILLSLWRRFIHLTLHMNMFVPVGCAFAARLMPSPDPRLNPDRFFSRSMAVVLLANWMAFSVLGGALLTRYLLPMYPLVILICVLEWKRHMRRWLAPAGLTAIAFLCAIWINPPYSFAPEDNLAYRDMIVLHQHAAKLIERRWPGATVLTTWPATTELAHPDLGYVIHPLRCFPIGDFTFNEIEKAAGKPEEYDTALIFSTKLQPPLGHIDLGKWAESENTRYFDFHRDLSPGPAAALLHGEIVWQEERKGQWIAVLRFPRIVDARLTRLRPAGQTIIPVCGGLPQNAC